MTTGLTYTTYVTELANLAVVSPSDAAFLANLPQCITYAENRMCRDIDFLQFSAANIGTLLANTRSITMPAGTFVVSEQINLITPSGTSNPDNGNRVPLLPITKEFIDQVYGSSSATGQPKYFVPFNDNLFLIAPYSDLNYSVEIVGTIRPDSLSNSNTSTFISTYFPDLFLMASMVFISGYQRNFGRQSDDPQMAVSYESQYQALLQGAKGEEGRKKFEASGWSSQAPAAATPSRG